MMPPENPPASAPLLPESFKQPHLLWWIAVLPQLVLLLINARAFSLVSGELELWQRSMAFRIGAFEIFLIAGALALAFYLRLRQRQISWLLNWLLLIAPILYLWLFVAQLGGLLPRSVSTWILPQEQLLYYQFALIMPLIFYAGVRLACAESAWPVRTQATVVMGVLVGVPLCWLAAVQILERVTRFDDALSEAAIAVLIGMGVISTLFLLGAAMRACVAGYVGVRRAGPVALGILSFVVGLAMPVGGLWLNSTIPFPSDFQSWPVYAMALANGCALLLPDFRRPLLRRLVWLLQCALFPFTLYFFLVFLPFLPLSVPAMIAVGAGFLILTPTALFLVHGQRILDGYRHEIGDGRRRVPAVLGMAALAILPGIYVTEAIVDRVVLRSALDYVYSPDYRAPDQFSGSRSAVQRSLERLRDFKAGLNLPFLSDFYNWAVFDNLVLPDEKSDAIHGAFFGVGVRAAESGRVSFLSGRPERGGTWREVPPLLPPSDVSLANLSPATVHEGDCDRTTLTLDLQNNAAIQSEYVTQIKIPEGVFVSGFWLKIGEERVPGRLFEKKSALWVYQQIRDRSRRDPGILVYSDPHAIELRVFPFEAHEQRRVEIEFLYPAALHPAVTIGDREWRAEGDAPGICLASTSADTSAVSLTPSALAALPRAKRVPYLQFIVDRSAAANLSDEETANAIRKTAAAFPEATECAVMFANYECAEAATAPLPLASLTAASLKTALPLRGGFLAERAIKRALLAYHDRLSRAATEKFPIIVLLHEPLTDLSFRTDLEHFGRLAPDTSEFYVTADGQSLTAFDFKGNRPNSGGKPHPVALLKCGDAIAPCALDAKETQVVQFDASKSEPSLSVYENGAFLPLAATATIPRDAPYSRGVHAWQRYLDWIYNPSLGNSGLAEIVGLSRETGILIAATSYIVVENSAQWKMLELKERQKLRNQTALEFEQVPEPGGWALLVVGGAILIVWQRKRAARANLKNLSS